MENFGAYLKGKREAKNVRLEEIASITKIHIHNLRLLENGAWSELPPDPFIRGFIMAYAKYIGLDPKETVRVFLTSRDQPVPDSSDAPTVQDTRVSESSGDAETLITTSGKTPHKRLVIATAGALAIGVVIAISSIGRRSSEELSVETLTDQETVSDKLAPGDSSTETAAASAVSGNEVVAPAPDNAVAARDTAAVATASSPSVPVVAAEEARKQHEIVIEGKNRTWMKIVIDDQKPRETFLKEGETVTLTAYDKIKLVLGNSTGTKVVHNGELVTGEKFNGTIRSYIFPKNARFPQDPPKRTAAATESNESAAPVLDGAASAPPAEAPVESN